ncbi:penicillin-binding transpeptidase domain-containing protein, partial [Streptomyces sp. P9(2023)]|uniref:penicillin-binding transpeptidase domain-containing protein n=1 Tax=Streptomyces sp. P9(2023) TaxID=3064394 RepID=UPI0028F43646
VKEFQTVREALIQSTNITAYNTYETLKAKTSPTFSYDNYLAKMGYPNSDKWSMESAPLGPMDVTTLQQTNGFQTLANNGVYKEG